MMNTEVTKQSRNDTAEAVTERHKATLPSSACTGTITYTVRNEPLSSHTAAVTASLSSLENVMIDHHKITNALQNIGLTYHPEY